MPSLFTQIIQGDLPGRFVWEDDQAVGFLTIEPLTPGHTLVVPKLEVDHWLDLSPNLVAHLTNVSHKVGESIHDAFGMRRVGVVIAGFEVPHVHVHVFGANQMSDFDFKSVNLNASGEMLDESADKIRKELAKAGHPEVVEHR